MGGKRSDFKLQYRLSGIVCKKAQESQAEKRVYGVSRLTVLGCFIVSREFELASKSWYNIPISRKHSLLIRLGGSLTVLG